EAAAVPRHDLGRVLVDAVEEALDQLALILSGQRKHPERALALLQHAGNDDDAMEMQWQEIVAGRLATQLESHLGDLAVGNALVEVVETPQSGDIGNGLDVENDNRRHSGIPYLRTQTPLPSWSHPSAGTRCH